MPDLVATFTCAPQAALNIFFFPSLDRRARNQSTGTRPGYTSAASGSTSLTCSCLFSLDLHLPPRGLHSLDLLSVSLALRRGGGGGGEGRAIGDREGARARGICIFLVATLHSPRNFGIKMVGAGVRPLGGGRGAGGSRGRRIPSAISPTAGWPVTFNGGEAAVCRPPSWAGFLKIPPSTPHRILICLYCIGHQLSEGRLSSPPLNVSSLSESIYSSAAAVAVATRKACRPLGARMGSVGRDIAGRRDSMKRRGVM